MLDYGTVCMHRHTVCVTYHTSIAIPYRMYVCTVLLTAPFHQVPSHTVHTYIIPVDGMIQKHQRFDTVYIISAALPSPISHIAGRHVVDEPQQERNRWSFPARRTWNDEQSRAAPSGSEKSAESRLGNLICAPFLVEAN